MLDIASLRQKMPVWAKMTYQDGLILFADSDTNIRLVEKVLKSQELQDKPMNGNSVQGIPLKYEGPLHAISFSEIFYDCLCAEKLSPISYIIEIINETEHIGCSIKLTTGIVGRGLRAFPSFLREMDLAVKFTEFFTRSCLPKNKS